MGAAAAVSFRRAGFRVILWLRDRNKLDATRRRLFELDRWMRKHVGPPRSKDGRVEVVTDLSVVDEQADLILDAIAEVMSEKATLLRKLHRARERGAIFITTTSGLSITELARRSGTGRMLVGAHFWNPPHLMPLVEVIRGRQTDQAVMERVVELMQFIGKIPVRVNKDVPGFIGNRLQHAMWREAIYLVQRGIASAEDVDRVARLTFGLRLPAVGPLENMDLVGLDLVHLIHEYLFADLADAHRSLPLLAKRVKRRQLGMKTGTGFYDWHQRDAKALIERRDRQIVHQLAFLQKLGALECGGSTPPSSARLDTPKRLRRQAAANGKAASSRRTPHRR